MNWREAKEGTLPNGSKVSLNDVAMAVQAGEGDEDFYAGVCEAIRGANDWSVEEYSHTLALAIREVVYV